MTQHHTEPADLHELVAQARARSAGTSPAPSTLTEPTLPTSSMVPLVTLSTDQLHDLVYAAASEYLHGLTGLRSDVARQHARRIAAQAELIAHREYDVRPGVPS